MIMKNRRTSTLQVILDNMKQNLELVHYSECENLKVHYRKN